MFFPVFAALGLTIASSTPKLKVAVVDVSTGPAMLGMGQQVSQAVLAEAQAQGFVVLTPDDVLAKLGAKAYEELVACGGRAECVARKLDPLGADRAVVGTFNHDEKSYLVHLWLVDVHAHELMAEVDRSILIASRRLLPDLKLALPDLLKGKKEARGTLRLTSNVKSANVTVDGAFAGKTPLDVSLKPGKHEVRLDKKAYLPVTRLVTVAPEAVTEDEVRLLLIPGEHPEDEPLPSLTAAPAPPPQGRGGLNVPVAGWVALGTSAALVGVGAIFGNQASQTEKQLKAGYDSTAQLYAGTRAQALSGQRDALIANILFAGAGAALATGIVWTALSQGTESVQVSPSAAPGGAGVVVGGRF